jgi:hypothetical protein
MAYMPDYGVGYFFSINSEAGEDAFYRIDKLIRAYLTNKLQKPSLPPAAPLPPSTAEYAGWYEPASPRTELFHFVERLAGISRIRFKDGKLLFTSLGGWNEDISSRHRYAVPSRSQEGPTRTGCYARVVDTKRGRPVYRGRTGVYYDEAYSGLAGNG